MHQEILVLFHELVILEVYLKTRIVVGWVRAEAWCDHTDKEIIWCCNKKKEVTPQWISILSALLFAVPPGATVILNSTSLSISPSVMVAQTSLNRVLSSGVVYSLAVNAMAIPAL